LAKSRRCSHRRLFYIRYQVNVGRLGRGWVMWGRFGDEWGSDKFERVDGQIGVKYSW
jgi:hypothetical protein